MVVPANNTFVAKLVAIGQAPTQLADVVMLTSSILMAIGGICAVPKLVVIGLMDREVVGRSLSFGLRSSDQFSKLFPGFVYFCFAHTLV
eukprot:Skav201988  [mRNA]  locus=scaffold269:46533:53029:+ [translate_table: standard]